MSAVVVAPDTPVPTGPYIGLTNFGEEHSALFFGRGPERKVLISNLRASRLTLLHAESGVGKSSLLRAGVAARLRELALREPGGPGNIPVVFSSWRDDPTGDLVNEIGRTVASHLGVETLPLPSGLEDALHMASIAAEGATLLVILDQFEEYFLYRTRERPRGRFVEELARCVNAHDLRANFLIAIREDAYAGLGDLFQGHIDNIYGNFLRLENLTRRAARDAIVRPIERYNDAHPDQEPVTWDPELVDAVLAQLRPADFVPEQAGKGKLGGPDDDTDAADDGIPAPYLQLVMQCLWEEDTEEKPHRLRLKTLERLGGASTIVRTHVDRKLSGLPDDDRTTAFEIFRHLVTPSGTKIALGPADLTEYSSEPEAELQRLLERLAASDTRILRTVPAPRHSGGGTRYEITHDLLAPAILNWRTRERRKRLELEARLAREQADAERRRARLFKALAIGAAVLLLLACGLALLARSYAGSARDHERVAEARRLAASAESNVAHDPELATLLALRAIEREPGTEEAENALRDALPHVQLRATLAPPTPLRSVEFSSDGRRILAASADGSLRLWDAATRRPVKTVTGLGALNDASLSTDGRRIVTAEDDGTALVLDATSGRVVRTLAPDSGAALTSAAFSPDGRSIVTGGADGIARVWDVARARQTAKSTSERDHVLLSVTFSPDGKRALTASASGRARIWDVATGRSLTKFNDGTGLLSAAFSPDGRQVVVGGGNWQASVWDSTSGEQLGLLDPKSGDMNLSVAYSRTGRQIATGSGDGLARLWDAKTHHLLRTFGAKNTDTMTAVALSPDGRTLATAAAGGALRLWNARTGRQAAQLTLPPGRNQLRSAALSDDGQKLATASRFGTVTIYKRTKERAARAWKPLNVISMPLGDAVNDVAFDSTGDQLATANQSGRWYVWSVPEGGLVASNYDAWRPLNTVEFDPTGRDRLVSASDDGHARVYALASKRLLQTLGDGVHPIHAAHFSPDGKVVVEASDDGARIWNVRTGRQEGESYQPGYPSFDAAIRKHRDQLVMGSTSAIADMYDLRSGGYLAPVDTDRPDTVRAIAYSADGRLLVTAGTGAAAHIWDANTRSELLSLVGHQGPITSAQFSKEGSELVTASADGTAKLWEASPIEQRALLPGTKRVYTAIFNPSGDGTIASASAAGVRIFDAGRRPVKPKTIGPKDVGDMASGQYSRDGRFLVTTDGFTQLMVWDVADSAVPLATIDISEYDRCNQPAGSAARQLDGATFSSDGKLVVTASIDGTACIWDWRAKKLVRHFREPTGAAAGATGVSGVSGIGMRWAVFSHDDKSVLTANDDGTARIWDARRNDRWVRVFRQPTGAPVNGAWYSPDGKQVITASSDGTARTWNVDDGSLEHSFVDPDRSEVYNATFSPDGRYVATCSGAARIWSVESGRQITSFQYGHTLSDCEFSPDGSQIVTAGTDGQTRVFSTELLGTPDALKGIAGRRVTRGLTVDERDRFRVNP